jgi:DNA-binding NtrC family response regulator
VSDKVLLIGRDSPFMRTLSERIASSNWRVHLAENGSEALAIAQSEDIDVAVINMSDLAAEGMRILESVRKDCPQTEFITLTSPSSIHWSIEGMKRGVYADLLIPFDNKALLGKLREAGARKRARLRGKKRSLRRKIEELLVSATFAESGSFDVARQIIGQEQEGRVEPKKGEEK